MYRPTGKNLLVDVKGRQCVAGSKTLQNWATREDIDDLRQWQEIFGEGFAAIFVFMYHWPGAPEAAPFSDLFAFQSKWYAMLGVEVEDYRKGMKTRSEAWGTVHVPVREFRTMARPFEDWL